MDFRFTPEQEAFRQELKEFARSELPPGWQMLGEEYGEDTWEITRAIAKKLGQRGWLTMSWPKEYGGQDASPIVQAIYQEETMYHGVPGTDMGVGGISWVGPALMHFGNEEQKREHLPPISRGERFWCTGYSEPGAGSDLASLQARATRDGDDYVINGQKTWTSAAHRSDWCWLAARTDPAAPKHKGISMFVVDMKTPGITVRPIINMADGHSFNEVYLDDARLPQRNLVGRENWGWYQLAVALDYERSGVRYPAIGRRVLEGLLTYTSEATTQGRALEPALRHRLADMAIEIEVCRLLCYRVAWLQAQKQVPNYEASQGKLMGTEMQRRLANVAMQVLGLHGQLEPGSKEALLQGQVENWYLSSVSATIAAGTSEIQRNIIAQRGLGLPR